MLKHEVNSIVNHYRLQNGRMKKKNKLKPPQPATIATNSANMIEAKASIVFRKARSTNEQFQREKIPSERRRQRRRRRQFLCRTIAWAPSLPSRYCIHQYMRILCSIWFGENGQRRYLPMSRYVAAVVWIVVVIVVGGLSVTIWKLIVCVYFSGNLHFHIE